MEETPGILIFLGRFHALVVHLPIGFVCIAVLIEIFFRRSKDVNVRPLVTFIWLLAALSATVSVVLGYFLSLQGGYDDNTLRWHKWAGILLALTIHVCYFTKKYPSEKPWTKYITPVSLAICTLLLIVTGHYGGSLTHGSEYLSEYKPGSLSELLGGSSENGGTVKKISSLDSADIFTDAVMPILKAKCVSCHNAEKKKGELVLSFFEEMLKGGEDGPGVVPGNLEKSGIYYRITLPQDHKKFMPTDGKKPLTPQQVAIIKWWIEKQAPQTALIHTLQPDSAMRKTFTTYFGITENAGSMDLEVPPADPKAIIALTHLGFQVSALSAKSNLLQATFNGAGTNKIDLTGLTAVKEQLVWLKITNARKLDDVLSVLGQLINLRKLTLNDCEITDGDLSTLTNLEILNLYGAKLSVKSVEAVLQLKKLRHLYLGGMNLDSLAVTRLSAQYPKVKIEYRQPDNTLPVTDSVVEKKN